MHCSGGPQRMNSKRLEDRPPSETMKRYLRRLPVFLAAMAAATGMSDVQAAETTVTINATILEVQCTAAQRLRIRACAAGAESYSTETAKTPVTGQAANGTARTLEPRYEVRLEPKRQVLIKTVLY